MSALELQHYFTTLFHALKYGWKLHWNCIKSLLKVQQSLFYDSFLCRRLFSPFLVVTQMQQLQRRLFLGERTFRDNVTISNWCVLDS